jgi:hypothetical protein
MRFLHDDQQACKENIGEGSLRLATLTRSPFFDGLQPNWHHQSCFFKLKSLVGLSAATDIQGSMLAVSIARSFIRILRPTT